MELYVALNSGVGHTQEELDRVRDLLVAEVEAPK